MSHDNSTKTDLLAAIVVSIIILLMIVIPAAIIMPEPEANSEELVTVWYMFGSNPTQFQTTSEISPYRAFIQKSEHTFGIGTSLYLLWHLEEDKDNSSRILYTFIDYELALFEGT